MKTDSCNTTKIKIGDVFTPFRWGRFAIEQFGIFERWMNGSTVFDPTMGQGNLLITLVQHGVEKGFKPKELPILNLFGNELNTDYYQKALQFFQDEFNTDMSKNFSNLDILELPCEPFDIIFGNPPWQNFNDLPEAYKKKIKPHFEKYQLTGNKRKLLLGHSRIDIAALIIKATIRDFLIPGGDAYFFMPLSLLLNDGAHEAFRNYISAEAPFAPMEIFDFNKEDVFNKIATRYGLVHFQRNRQPEFPIRYKVLKNQTWELLYAAPLTSLSAGFSIFEDLNNSLLNSFSKIPLNKKNQPRQGLNTCGANKLFFFNECSKLDEETYLLNNTTELPSAFIFPLLTAANFRNEKNPTLWVLLPYTKDGRPLSAAEIKRWPQLNNYLCSAADLPKARKGTLIRSWINKGIWWALLGVGPYNYAPYKIVWEAYGRKKFSPQIFEGKWQANQALQAFIPCYSQNEAKSILKKLQNPVVEKILLSHRMEGTMNWAQPGKIKKLIEFI